MNTFAIIFFTAVLSVIGFIGVQIINWMKRITDAVNKINIFMEVQNEKNKTVEKEINDLKAA